MEQYENLRGLCTKEYCKTEANQIRRTADMGVTPLSTVVATIFGERLENVKVSTAYDAMGLYRLCG